MDKSVKHIYRIMMSKHIHVLKPRRAKECQYAIDNQHDENRLWHLHIKLWLGPDEPNS